MKFLMKLLEWFGRIFVEGEPAPAAPDVEAEPHRKILDDYAPGTYDMVMEMYPDFVPDEIPEPGYTLADRPRYVRKGR